MERRIELAGEGERMPLGARITERLKIFRFLLDFWESWRLSRVRNGVGI
jgi:hypothetical protein